MNLIQPSYKLAKDNPEIIWLRLNKLRAQLILPILSGFCLMMLPLTFFILDIMEYGMEVFLSDGLLMLPVFIATIFVAYIFFQAALSSNLKRIGILKDKNVLFLETYNKIAIVEADTLLYSDKAVLAGEMWVALSVDDLSFDQLIQYVYPALAQGTYMPHAKLVSHLRMLRRERKKHGRLG